MCLAGEYGANCSKCGLGSFRTGDDSDASKCNACPSGFHQNALGQASCLPCVPGRFNRVERQENCTKCAINTYAPKTEMIACIDCEIGKQVTTPGAAACHSCAAGKFGDDCSLCEIGKFRGGDNINASVCYKCPTGYHQKSKGQAACFPCVPGMCTRIIYRKQTVQVVVSYSYSFRSCSYSFRSRYVPESYTGSRLYRLHPRKIR